MLHLYLCSASAAITFPKSLTALMEGGTSGSGIGQGLRRSAVRSWPCHRLCGWSWATHLDQDFQKQLVIFGALWGLLQGLICRKRGTSTPWQSGLLGSQLGFLPCIRSALREFSSAHFKEHYAKADKGTSSVQWASTGGVSAEQLVYCKFIPCLATPILKWGKSKHTRELVSVHQQGPHGFLVRSQLVQGTFTSWFAWIKQ